MHLSKINLPDGRIINAAGFLICVVAFAFALIYLQYMLGLEPCPLCVIDRIVILAMASVFLIAMLHNPSRLGQRIYGMFNIVFACIGIAVAARHVWLQHLPTDQVPSCGPGLEYMLEAFPLFDVLDMVLRGSGECADISWEFLGMSIPEQVLLLFLVLASLSIVQMFRRS